MLKVETGSILNIVDEYLGKEPEESIEEYVGQLKSKTSPVMMGEKDSIIVALSAIKNLRDK